MRDVGHLVDVDFVEAYGREIIGHGDDLWGDGFAGAAPGGEEVHDEEAGFGLCAGEVGFAAGGGGRLVSGFVQKVGGNEGKRGTERLEDWGLSCAVCALGKWMDGRRIAGDSLGEIVDAHLCKCCVKGTSSCD